jgi:hypothetical protein
LKLVLDNRIDTASARALTQRNSQLRELCLISRGNNLNMAIIGVPHPAIETEFSRLPLHKPAKANTLNPALDQKVKNHKIYARLM